jgi:hypothetical protein
MMNLADKVWHRGSPREKFADVVVATCGRTDMNHPSVVAQCTV